MTGTPGPGGLAPAPSAGPAPASPRGPGRWSLRLRLTLLTAGVLCVGLAAGALILTNVLSASRVDALDDIARDRATTVATLAGDDRLPAALPVGEPGELVQLLDADGLVVASSPNASRTLPVLPRDVVDALRAEAVERAGRTGGGDGADGAEGAGAPVLVTGTGESAYDGDARVAVVPVTYRGAPATVVATVPLAEVRGLLDALRLALVGVVPVLTALLAAVIWTVLGRALHPVEQLRQAAAQVARTGGPGSLPVRRAHDELGALTRTLNEMLDRLEVAAARQRTFVGDAAHELRSPLASLRTSIEVARAHPEAYTGAELAEDLEAEVLRMQALVDDLLLLARVGSTRAEPAGLDLLDVVRGALDASGAVAARPEVALTVSGAGRAHADAPAALRAVRNLLDNAVRHAAGRVEVGVADGTVTVDDDGAGIPVADRERVFERFVRLDDAREREAGGSGLGLAIAREVARENGGDVELGESPAGGARAVLRLPP